jgi:hypothetical protein
LIKKNNKIKALNKFSRSSNARSIEICKLARLRRDSNRQISPITLREELLRKFFDANFALRLLF